MFCFHKDAHDTTEVGLVALLSSSDHSDIVTLNSKEHVQACEEEVEGASGEELYLGTPCSSQYTFTATDTGRSCLFLFNWLIVGENIKHFYKTFFFPLHFSSISNQVLR